MLQTHTQDYLHIFLLEHSLDLLQQHLVVIQLLGSISFRHVKPRLLQQQLLHILGILEALLVQSGLVFSGNL